VPASTYAAGSKELAFFHAYNEFRAQAGLGKLAQHAKLDLAAKNHLNYQQQNTDLDLFATAPATGRESTPLDAGLITKAGREREVQVNLQPPYYERGRQEVRLIFDSN